MKNKELQDLTESFAKVEKNFKELRAAMPEKEDIYSKCMDSMYSMVNNLHDRINRVSQAGYDYQDSHAKNNFHLPQLTASQKEKLLKAAGADGDFEVMKKPIYASRASKNNFNVDLNLKK